MLVAVVVGLGGLGGATGALLGELGGGPGMHQDRGQPGGGQPGGGPPPRRPRRRPRERGRRGRGRRRSRVRPDDDLGDRARAWGRVHASSCPHGRVRTGCSAASPTPPRTGIDPQLRRRSLRTNVCSCFNLDPSLVIGGGAPREWAATATRDQRRARPDHRADQRGRRTIRAKHKLDARSSSTRASCWTGTPVARATARRRGRGRRRGGSRDVGGAVVLWFAALQRGLPRFRLLDRVLGLEADQGRRSAWLIRAACRVRW